MTGWDYASMMMGFSFSIVLLAVALCAVAWTVVGSWALWKDKK